MHNADKEALEQAKVQQTHQPNGQPRPTTQQPSDGINPIPTPVTVAAAKIVAGQQQQQFNELVVACLVQGFFGADVSNLGAIGQAILDESTLAMPLTIEEFRSAQAPALPPAS